MIDNLQNLDGENAHLKRLVHLFPTFITGKQHIQGNSRPNDLP